MNVNAEAVTDEKRQQMVASGLNLAIRGGITEVLQEYEKAGRDADVDTFTEAVNEGITRAVKGLTEALITNGKKIRADYDHGHKFVGKLDEPNVCVHCGQTRPAPAEEIDHG